MSDVALNTQETPTREPAPKPTDGMTKDEVRVWNVAKAAWEADHERAFEGGRERHWESLRPNERFGYMEEAKRFIAMLTAANRKGT